jgi:hypothetical protein
MSSVWQTIDPFLKNDFCSFAKAGFCMTVFNRGYVCVDA